MLGTVAKAGRVLELFTPSCPEWGVTELAVALGQPKSNVHELLSSLVGINLLQRSTSGRYRLSWRIVSMANSLKGAGQLRSVAPHFLWELATATGMTTHLTVWDGERQVFLCRARTPESLDQAHALPGCYLPAHCTASGKLLLAEIPWSDVEKRFATQGLVPRTRRSLRSVSALLDDLAQTAERGYGLNEEEADEGVAAVAVPVRDATGGVVAALGVSMAHRELDDFRGAHMSAVRRTAARLSMALASQADAVSAPTAS